MKNNGKDRWEHTACSRRSLLKCTGVGFAGLSLASMINAPIEEQVACATQNVKRSSSPSQLRITDLRIALVTGAPFRCPLIRIDTNQGISGYGEVRDSGSERYALILKSRLLSFNSNEKLTVWFVWKANKVKRLNRAYASPLSNDKLV